MADIIKIINSAADTIAVIHSIAQQIKKAAQIFDDFKKERKASGQDKGPMLKAGKSIANEDGNGEWIEKLITASGVKAEDRMESVTKVIKTMLALGVDLNAKDKKNGETLLHKVAKLGMHQEVIIGLIAAGADVNALDATNETPLHSAVLWASNPDVVSALLAGGAKVNAKAEGDKTPLHMVGQMTASEHDQETQEQAAKIMHILLAAGAEVNATGVNGTPLHMAALHGVGGKAINVLLEAGAEVKAVDGDMNTPLHSAAVASLFTNNRMRRNISEETIDALVKAGAPLDARNVDNKTAEDITNATELSGLVFRNAVRATQGQQSTVPLPPR